MVIKKEELNGFAVASLATILKDTLICIYLGPVKSYDNELDLPENDSAMTLLDKETATAAKQHLYVEANLASNIAPFISGIPKGFKRQANCTTRRLYVCCYGGNWIPLIIVKSTAQIEPGDFLYYDYGGEEHHPEKFTYIKGLSESDWNALNCDFDLDYSERRVTTAEALQQEFLAGDRADRLE